MKTTEIILTIILALSVLTVMTLLIINANKTDNEIIDQNCFSQETIDDTLVQVCNDN